MQRILLALVVVCISATTIWAAGTKQPPNILFAIADDWGVEFWDATGRGAL